MHMQGLAEWVPDAGEGRRKFLESFKTQERPFRTEMQEAYSAIFILTGGGEWFLQRSTTRNYGLNMEDHWGSFSGLNWRRIIEI